MHNFSSDLQSFDPNILSFENSLFSTIGKDLIRSWIFRYFSFTFYIQFIAWKLALEIKRTFDQFTLVHSSLILKFITEGHLWAGNKLAQNLIVGELLYKSSIVLLTESYSGQRERKSVWQGFQSKICELMSGKLSKCLYIHSYTHLIISSALNEHLLVHNFQNNCSTECHW